MSSARRVTRSVTRSGDEKSARRVARSRRNGKDPVEDLAGGEVADVRLPERLFATDRFPSRRLNCYSSIDYLLIVRDVLKGTPEMAEIMSSCFGRLFNIPARRLTMSGKLVHGMLVRQLVTKKKYELWIVFGGQPLRFSLTEFGEVTGLPCGEFEEGYSCDYQVPPTDENYLYWEKLIGRNRSITIAELVAMLVEDPDMPGWRRLRLCLLIIVDGVLIATTQAPKPTLKYVKMLENLEKFLSFPWGRESFVWTISTMKPVPKWFGVCEDPLGDFCKKLRQKTLKMVGFPVALQLLAFEACPQLVGRLSGEDKSSLLEFPGGSLPQHSGLVLTDVLGAEHDEGVSVLH